MKDTILNFAQICIEKILFKLYKCVYIVVH